MKSIGKSTFNFAAFYLILIFSFFSSLQVFGKSADYFGYYNIFVRGKFYGGRESTEPFFSLLRYLNDIFFRSSLFTIYLFSSFLALNLKWKAIKRCCDKNRILIFASYIFAFYWIQEYTQIRAACAIGIFLCAADDLEHHDDFSFFLKSAVAVLFHYSALSLFLFYFYQKISAKKKIYILLPVLGFLFALTIGKKAGADFRNFFYSAEKFFKLNKAGNVITNATPLNLKYVYLLILFVFLSIFLNEKDGKNFILMKAYSFGLCFYFWLNQMALPVVSVRFAEFYTTVFVLYSFNMYSKIKIKEKSVLRFIPVLSILFYGYASLRTSGILQ
jgi:hypothetical protein